MFLYILEISDIEVEMASIKVTALWVEDGKSNISSVSPVLDDKKLNYDSDAFGYGCVENYEQSGIERYPFVMEDFGDGLALLDWGSTIEKNTATLDVLDRPLSVGGIITYNETDEDGVQHGPYSYRISSIEPFA